MRVLVLLGVNAEAGGDEVHAYAINVLNQTLDRRKQLLKDVPVKVNTDLAVAAGQLIRVVGLPGDTLFLHIFCCFLLPVVQADHVWNKASNQIGLGLALGLLPESDSNMGQSFDIRVFGRRLGQLLCDDVLCNCNLVFAHLTACIVEVLVEFHDDLFTFLAR